MKDKLFVAFILISTLIEMVALVYIAYLAHITFGPV